MRPLPLLAILALSSVGCSSSPSGESPPPPPPPRVATTIEVTADLPRSGSSGYTLWGGLTAQLSAVVKDKDGVPIEGAAVTWTPSTPEWLTVDQSGRLAVRDSAVGSRFMDITARSGNATGRLSIFSSDWSLSETVDQVNQRTTVYAVRPSSGGGTYLYVRCRAGAFEIYVSGSEITRDGAVEYRFSGSPSVNATWLESTDFKALFARNEATAKDFADRLLTADTLIFRYGKYLGGSVTSTFLLRNARYAHPRIWNRCL